MKKTTDTGFPILPFLDPDFDANHPIHHIKPIPEDPYAPLTKSQKKRILAAQLDQAMSEYTPPHVVRSWEANKFRAEKHWEILALKLSDDEYERDGLPTPLARAREDFERRENSNDSSATRRLILQDNPLELEDSEDFRRFAVHILRLGYHRFHLSTNDDFEPSADPVDTPEPDICWIMEYTEGECSTIRRQLSHLIGLYPATTDETIEAYDDEIASRYYRRLKSRCRRRNTRCIRPSHIEIFTQCGRILP